MVGVNEARKELTTRPSMLKHDSEATVDIGMASTSFTISVKPGYLTSFYFHHLKISKSGTTFLIGSVMYLSISCDNITVSLALNSFIQFSTNFLLFPPPWCMLVVLVLLVHEFH